MSVSRSGSRTQRRLAARFGRLSASRRRCSATVRLRQKYRHASPRRGRGRAVLDKRGPDLLRRVVVVYTTITQSQIFVLDQDEALEFYVSVLGLEVHTDADLGFMRWLT